MFAAVAVDALCRSFETAVERQRGVTQLELFYAELDREEQQKQVRREQKKLKRKRKKERNAGGEVGVNKCEGCDEGKFEEKDDEEDKGM